MVSYCKIGFHGGSGAGMNGIMENYVTPLNAHGIPAIIKSANNAGLAADVAKSGIQYGVKNQIILRYVGHPIPDNPSYNIPPKQAAENHWFRHIKPKLDQSLELVPYKDQIWIEMINEADHQRWGSHVCQWATRLAELAHADGWKAVLLGANAGTPEPENWLEPGAVKFLHYLAQRPDQAAISVHEAKAPYPIDTDLEDLIPHMVGRFQYLLETCDRLQIAHPTIFVSEWAWAYASMPGSLDDAMSDVKALAEFYAQYPTLRGVFLWNLTAGAEWSTLPSQLNRLIVPLARYALSTTFPDIVPPQPDPQPILEPGVQIPEKIRQTVHLLPPDTSLTELQYVTSMLHPTRSTFTFSSHAAWAMVYAGDQDSLVIVWSGHRWEDDIFAWLHEKGIRTEAREFEG